METWRYFLLESHVRTQLRPREYFFHKHKIILKRRCHPHAHTQTRTLTEYQQIIHCISGSHARRLQRRRCCMAIGNLQRL